MLSDMASSDGLHRIIVGVDYGTTYSGISWVLSNQDSAQDIRILAKWPEHTGPTWKAPTTIAYASENKKKTLTRNHWGFETTKGLKGLKQYAWTKLLLDNNSDLTDFDDPLLKEMYGSGFLTLPSGKTAKDVAADYLREIYRHTMTILESEIDPTILRTMPMECWITTPAIWTHGAKNATLEAARAAGFGSRPGDVVNSISEPEAAALTALKPHLGPRAVDPVQAKECILICDCGGGTVDITTFQIDEISPTLKYKEICAGTGGKCGATSIDRAFIRWMTQKFGDAYTSVSMTKRGPGSVFMDSFESAKRNFGTVSNDRPIEISPISMNIPWSPLYDDDEEFVKISRRDMAALFDPSLQELYKMIDSQVRLVQQKAGRNIDRFILVGGFGDSKYLNTKLQEWRHRQGIKRFYCPEDCQAAIVKGAALRGLEGITPTSIIARRHYGWSMSQQFREGTDEEIHAYESDWDSTKLCRGRMHWPIKKDQDLDEKTLLKCGMSLSKAANDDERSFSLKLYSCSFITPPERDDHYSLMEIGTVTVNLAGVKNSDVDSRYNAKLGKTVYQYALSVEIGFKSQEGNLTVRVRAHGRESGVATIRYKD